MGAEGDGHGDGSKIRPINLSNPNNLTNPINLI